MSRGKEIRRYSCVNENDPVPAQRRKTWTDLGEEGAPRRDRDDRNMFKVRRNIGSSYPVTPTCSVARVELNSDNCTSRKCTPGVRNELAQNPPFKFSRFDKVS